MQNWNEQFKSEILRISSHDDPAHDFLHFTRVVGLAKKLCLSEGGKLEIVIPAAWFHDYIVIPKNDSRRTQASRISAEAALKFLTSIDYPKQYFDEIFHAIVAHSFSANIAPKTIEAKIVQDADRIDGLGAIGIARCFAMSGVLKRPFYSITDSFCSERKPDDSKFTIDHFYQKLFKTAESLQTESGKIEGHRRLEMMRVFLENLKNEIQI